MWLPMRDMGLGDAGTDVGMLQEAFGLPATGVYDKNTSRKIAQWQAANNLPRSGYFGAASREVFARSAQMQMRRVVVTSETYGVGAETRKIERPRRAPTTNVRATVGVDPVATGGSRLPPDQGVASLLGWSLGFTAIAAGAIKIRDGVKSVHKLGVCPEYMCPYDVAKFTDAPAKLQETVKHSKKVQAMVLRAQTEFNTALEALLFRPVQRMCVYPLLFKQALKALDEDTAEHKAFEECFEAVSKTIQMVNENVRMQEAEHHTQHLLCVQIRNASELLAPGRHLISEATVRFLNGEEIVFGAFRRSHGRKRVFAEVAPAYAVSVHKFQGSECDSLLYLNFSWKVGGFMTRNLLYTALTRAKKRALLVSSVPQLSACAPWAAASKCRMHVKACAASAAVPATNSAGTSCVPVVAPSENPTLT